MLKKELHRSFEQRQKNVFFWNLSTYYVFNKTNFLKSFLLRFMSENILMEYSVKTCVCQLCTEMSKLMMKIEEVIFTENRRFPRIRKKHGFRRC